MNTVLRNKLKSIKLRRGYYDASVLDLMNFEYRWEETKCPKCQIENHNFIIPPFGEFELLCIDCLQSTILKFSHDTNYGVASNSPLPDDMPDEFNLSLHLPSESIIKLLDTPEFNSIQSGIWLDHCNDFMDFIGIWEPVDFTNNSKTSGQLLFNEMTNEDSKHLWGMFELDENETKKKWEDVQYYSFKCTKCNILKGYWDMG